LTVYYAELQNRIYYECASLLEAVDVSLKASLVFNLHYSPAALSVWVFLQKAVYGIQTPSDNNSVKVLALITYTNLLRCHKWCDLWFSFASRSLWLP